MSWLRKAAKFSVIVVAVVEILGCGVKGDPVPPERPPVLGRGRPTYRRATEGMQLERTPRVAPVNESDKEDKEEDEND